MRSSPTWMRPGPTTRAEQRSLVLACGRKASSDLQAPPPGPSGGARDRPSMETRRWIGWLATAAMVALTIAMTRVDTETRIAGGTPAQQEMARWAIGRVEGGGLSLPSLEIRFHPTPLGCDGRSGGYSDGKVDLCGVHVNLMSR